MRWRHEWCEVEEDRLRELVAVPGTTVVAIAQQLGKPPRVVKNKMQNMRLSLDHPQTWTDERIGRLRALFLEGHSGSQIAEMLGVSRNSVIGKLHRLGLTRAKVNRPTKHRIKRQRKQAARRINVVKLNPLIELMKLPLPAEPPDEIARTTIADREKGQCAWIIGEPIDQMCCGLPIVGGLPFGTPYCEMHARRAFSPRNQERRGEFVLETISDALARKRARQEMEKEAA